jgi:hypothetical protein
VAAQSSTPAPATSGTPNPAPDAATAAPEAHDTRSSVATGDLGGSQDEQLTQALDMLRGLAMVTARNGR